MASHLPTFYGLHNERSDKRKYTKETESEQVREREKENTTKYKRDVK